MTSIQDISDFDFAGSKLLKKHLPKIRGVMERRHLPAGLYPMSNGEINTIVTERGEPITVEFFTLAYNVVRNPREEMLCMEIKELGYDREQARAYAQLYIEAHNRWAVTR